MATAAQSVGQGRRANPLWPFRSPQDRIISSCETKPSGETLRTALKRAYAAGKRIGSNDVDYANWLCKSGLAQRSATVRKRLKQEYERGMSASDGKTEIAAPEASPGIQEEVLSALSNLGAKQTSAKKAVAQAVREGLTDFDGMFRRAVEIARVRNPDYYVLGYAAGEHDARAGKRRPYGELSLLAPEGPGFEELHRGYLHGNLNEYYRLHPKRDWKPLGRADNPGNPWPTDRPWPPSRVWVKGDKVGSFTQWLPYADGLLLLSSAQHMFFRRADALAFIRKVVALPEPPESLAQLKELASEYERFTSPTMRGWRKRPKVVPSALDNPSSGSEIGAAAQVAAERTRALAGDEIVEVSEGGSKLVISKVPHRMGQQTFRSAETGLLVRVGGHQFYDFRCGKQNRLVGDRELEHWIQLFLSTGRLR